MDRRDESIVWDQYAPSVATDGSFLPRSPDPAFQKLSGATPDGSSGALGGNSQGSPGAFSDPCKTRILNASVPS